MLWFLHETTSVSSSILKDDIEDENMSTAIPTDSVLRRHYETMQGRHMRRQASSQCKGGFLSWLRKIFSG